MPMDFSTFIVQLNDAIIVENGPNLAYLLRPTSPHGKDLVKEFRNPTVSTSSKGLPLWISPNSVALWADMTDVCNLLGTILRSNTSWSALTWQRNATLRRSRKNRSLYREPRHWLPFNGFLSNSTDCSWGSSLRTGVGHCQHCSQYCGISETWRWMSVPINERQTFRR